MQSLQPTREVRKVQWICSWMRLCFTARKGEKAEPWATQYDTKASAFRELFIQKWNKLCPSGIWRLRWLYLDRIRICTHAHTLQGPLCYSELAIALESQPGGLGLYGSLESLLPFALLDISCITVPLACLLDLCFSGQGHTQLSLTLTLLEEALK